MSRIVVADDHGLLRQGMRLLLGDVLPGCVVVEAGSYDATLAALRGPPTELLLVDLDMPGMQGVTSVQSLRALFPAVKIAVVSGSANTETIVGCLAAGASGYMLKEEPVEEIGNAVQAILEGYTYVSASLQGAVDAQGMPGLERPNRLTSRQMDVLRQLTLGRSNKEIARALGMSDSTVKIHLAAIFRMLGARNRTEAVVLAARLKL